MTRRGEGEAAPNCSRESGSEDGELVKEERKEGRGGGERAREKKREKSAAGTTYFHRANGAAAVFTPLKGTLNSRMLEIFMTRASF